MDTQPREIPDDIESYDITTGRAVPGTESSGQHVLLLMDGKPVVLEPLFGNAPQVLTTSGMVDLPGGVELDEYYSATPEEIERLEALASEMLSPGGSDEGAGGGIGLFTAMPPYQGLSAVTPHGGIMVIHSDMLDIVPMRDLPSSDDATTVDDLLSYLDRLRAHNGPPERFGPDDDPQYDDPDDGPQVDHALLDLSGVTEAIRIDLSTKEYVPAAGGDAKSISDEVTKVVGAADYDNVIIGDDRDNELTGGERSDRILGMGGDDTIYMNTFLDSSDTIDGGGGDDTLSFTQSSANPTDALDGVTNVEHVLLGDADTSLTVADAIMTDAAQSMTIDARGIVSGGSLVFDGSAESQGAFSVYGSAAGDDITGGAGDDTLEGGAGADRLAGGGGNNTLSYASSGGGVDVSLDSNSVGGGDAEGDTVADWASFQNLIGSSSGDTLEGRASEANRLEGGGGNDLLKHTTGADTLDGGGGSDTFYFDADADGGTEITGGEGRDALEGGASIDYSGATIDGVEEVHIGDGHYARFGSSQIESGWTVNGTTGGQGLLVQADSTTVDLSGLVFNDWTSGEDVVSIHGTMSDETITGSSENDSITSGGGTDSIDAGAGNDTISLSDTPGSSTAIDGGAGTDVLAASGTVDLRQAASIDNIETIALTGTSALTLSTSQADARDWAMTGESDDTINLLGTGAGEETDLGSLDLTGLDGVLKYSGGDGNDALHMGTNLGSSVYVDGGSGTDSLTFTYSGDDYALRNVTNVEHVLLGDADTSLTVTNSIMTSASQSMTIDARDIVSGGDLYFDADMVSQGSFLVYGSGGDDIFYAGAGNDTLRGGDGADILAGGEGDDTLEGGAGADRFSGGGGNNTLSYASSGEGVDVSLKSGSASGGDAEGDTIIDWAEFNNLIGSSSGDTLEGRDGEANRLEGGDGGDLLKFVSHGDTLDGGGGSDTFYFDDDANSGTVIKGGEGTDILKAGNSIDYSGATISGVEGVAIGSGHYARFGSSQIALNWTVTGTGGGQGLLVQADSTTVDLSGLVFSEWTAGEDVVSILGTTNDETLTGSSENDSITSVGGVDSISGGAGNDTISLSAATGSSSAINGGAGNDVLAISGDVDLRNAASIDNIETLALDGASSLKLSATDAHEKDWTVTGAAGTTINVSGTASSEKTDLGDLDLTGFDGELKYSGGNGHDTLDMGTNMDSTVYVDGGGHTDLLTFTYSGDTGSLDHVTNVEYIKLGDALTTLTLTDDSLVGSGKSVTIDGSDLTHKFSFNGSSESDDLYILSGDGDDSLLGGAGDDTFSGGAGADTIDGGSGFDFVSYEGSPEGVLVRFYGGGPGGTYAGGWAQGDRLSNITGVIGSAHDDTFYPHYFNENQFYGMGGDDLYVADTSEEQTLCGGSGNDTLNLTKALGEDTILYESTSEVAQYTDTIINFSAAWDKLVFDRSFNFVTGTIKPYEFYNSSSTTYNGPCFLFHSNTLYYDADGAGDGDAHAVAVFEGLSGNFDYDNIEIDVL